MRHDWHFWSIYVKSVSRRLLSGPSTTGSLVLVELLFSFVTNLDEIVSWFTLDDIL
jgi:hypothetical protein